MPTRASGATVRCAIFDFDGTLADTFRTALDIANRLAPEFGFLPAPPDDIERLRDCSYAELGRELQVKMHKVPFIAHRVRREMATVIEHVQPVAGLPEVLRELRMRGFSLGVLSSNSRDNVERFLSRHDLLEFDFISTASNVWGKRRHLQRLLRRYTLSADEILYVGDETRDIDACRELSVPVAAVTWGYTRAARLRAHEPTYLLDAPYELLSLLPSTPQGETAC